MRFVGLSGAGKTRTLYEECVHHSQEDVYITMSAAHNGGSTAAKGMLQRGEKEGLKGDRLCCMFMGMLYTHLKFYYSYVVPDTLAEKGLKTVKLQRLFLMAQNTANRLTKHCGLMPTPPDDERAKSWMTDMQKSVASFASDPCILLDEIQMLSTDGDREEHNWIP
eukprot:1993848-Amphidinium_carterae.1